MASGDGTTATRSGGAPAVAAGILASRLAGFLRSSVSGALLGVGPHADVLQTALRAPNLLQNLLGEQTLSASFIPVYSRLLAAGRREEARRFAGAAFGLLAAVAAAAALIGMLAARPLVAIFAAGYLGDASRVAAGELAVDRFELAVAAVRWIFPMTACLVLSAWALGVLNSHRRFLLPYAAPVVWNAAILGGLAWVALAAGPLRGTVTGQTRLLFAACIGALAGGLLQFLIQLPAAWRALGGLRPRLELGSPPMREALAAFGPAVAGRGVVQLSSYVDQLLATLLAAGAVGALGYAQTLYLLPVSLFGMSVAAAALPELSRRSAGAAGGAELAAEARAAVARSGFLNLPSAIAYLLLGLPLVEGLYRLFPGSFGRPEAVLVTAVLAGYALGLPASTSARVVQTTFFALGDTRTPARIAGLRAVTSVTLGVPAMFWLDRWAVASVPSSGMGGSQLRFGAVALALATSVGAWTELIVLRRRLRGRLPELVWPAREQAGALAAALLAAVPGLAAWWLAARATWHPAAIAVAVAASFGAAYIGISMALNLPQLQWVRTRWRGDRRR